MKKSFFEKSFFESIKVSGWEKIDSGCSRCIDYNERFLLLHRERKISEIFKISDEHMSETPVISRVSATPPKSVMEHCMGGWIESPLCLPDNFISDMREQCTYTNEIVIMCNTFWVSNINHVLSYNLSVLYDSNLHSFIFFPFEEYQTMLSLDMLLGVILDYLYIDCRQLYKNNIMYSFIHELNTHGEPIISTCNSLNDAKRQAQYLFVNGNPSNIPIDEISKHKGAVLYKRKVDSTDSPLNVTLLCNYGLQFISSLFQDKGCIDLLSYRYSLAEHSKGLFTIKPITLDFNSLHNNGWNYFYNVKLSIRDAQLHDCTDNGKTDYRDFGRAADIKLSDELYKTEFKDTFSKSLDKYLMKHPCLYLDYASEYNTCILIYMTRIWGIGKSIPATISSAACDVAASRVMNYLGCRNETDFNKTYAGSKIIKGKCKNTTSGKFFRNGSTVALDDPCDNLQRYAALAYRGGVNACFSVDAHNDYSTYDIDIESAYPTAMCITPAVDWTNPIDYSISNRELRLDDFIIDGIENPMCPIFANVTYEFPLDCKFPCLPRYDEDDDEAPSYPLKETHGVYCSGAELYLALKMGAKIHVINGFRANILKEDGNTIYPIRPLVIELVNARKAAAARHKTLHPGSKEKCLSERVLKLCVNMIYGKISQFVSKMYGANSDKNGGMSKITNPVIASLTTSFIRSVIFASCANITDLNYHVYSATTDGLITDAPIESIETVELFGLRDYLVESRKIITGEANPSYFSVKHTQTDLLNLTTRGNASLQPSGVIARNGLSAKYPNEPKTSERNRQGFIVDAVSRTGKVENTGHTYPGLGDILRGEPYTQKSDNKKISLDFDMKRKPLKESLTRELVTVDGNSYEVAHIETVPFADTDEMLRYRKTRERCTCLRTYDEWSEFFKKISCFDSCSGITWADFKNCIIAYRMGICSIPCLDDTKLTVDEKVKIIQAANPCSGHTYTKCLWNKAAEKKNQDKLSASGFIYSDAFEKVLRLFSR